MASAANMEAWKTLTAANPPLLQSLSLPYQGGGLLGAYYGPSNDHRDICVNEDRVLRALVWACTMDGENPEPLSYVVIEDSSKDGDEDKDNMDLSETKEEYEVNRYKL